MKRLLKDKALRKTITYRISVLIGSGLIFLGSFITIQNPAGAIVGGFVVSEAYRSILYYGHEKLYEWKDSYDKP